MSGLVRLSQTPEGREKLAGVIDKIRQSKVVRSGGNFYGKSPSTGLYRKGLTEALWEGPARVLAAPVKGVKNLGASILFGRKQMFGPMAGKRVVPVSGSKGLIPIDKREYNAIRAGLAKGDAFKVRAGMSNAYFKRAYQKGGLVGFAKRRPLLAGALGLGGLLLASKPELRGVASEMVPTLPENEVSPEVESTFSQPVSQGSALNKSTWG